VTDVFVVDWESPRYGLMCAVFADAESALSLESRIVDKWGAGILGVSVTRELVRTSADVESIDIN
jgi:hypothetical protein